MTSSSSALRLSSAEPPSAQRIPQYLRVHNLLRRRIEDGEYPVGSFLPPEPVLGKKLNVSRTTVRKAVELLIGEGFLVVRRGRGTEILDFKAIQKLQGVTSFSETLREKGFEVRYRNVKVRMVLASAAVAKDLRVEAGSDVILVRRLALANGKPVAIMQNHLLPEIVPGIEAREARIQSLYAFLEAEYNLVIDAATDFISARAASAEEAKALAVAEGAPLLVVRRITYAAATPIERADLFIVAGRYEYSVHTHSRPGRLGP